MTIGEVYDSIKAYQRREKTKAKEILATNYNLAFMTATFVNYALNGHTLPSINEMYPDLIEDHKQKEVEDKSWMIYKEQFIDFANAHNKRRKKEGENK